MGKHVRWEHPRSWPLRTNEKGRPTAARLVEPDLIAAGDDGVLFERGLLIRIVGSEMRAATFLAC